MSNKGKVLIAGSSAMTLELKGGKQTPVGYYLNELAIPGQALVDAGYELVLATPSGEPPVVDAHSVDASHFGGSEEALQQALKFTKEHPAMVAPRPLRMVIDEGLDSYDGFFTPGGHPPMVDLMQDPDLGEILRHFHDKAKPTALLCHGPIAVAAAMPNARAFRAAMIDGDIAAAKKAAAGWQYAGYRMTIFSNDEERSVEQGVLHAEMPFYVVDALEIAGGLVETGGMFQPKVIGDRELITGQNPPSDHMIAARLVAALDRRVQS
jgi:putative intracellular protease/amidase